MWGSQGGDPLCCPSTASSQNMGCCWEKDAEPFEASHFSLTPRPPLGDPKSATILRNNFSPSISMTTLLLQLPPPLFKLGQQCLGFSLLFLLLILSPILPATAGVRGFLYPQTSWGAHGRGWWNLGVPTVMLCPLRAVLGDILEEGSDAASHHPSGFRSQREFARLSPRSSAPVRDDAATPSRLPPAFWDYISIKEIF